MQKLRIGDKTEDNSLIILDEDKLCYSVLSSDRGASGIRTISKKLLEEFVEFYRINTKFSPQIARKQLVGRTDIDRFEYGYASTLAKMAKMILGQITFVRADNPEAEELTVYNPLENSVLSVEELGLILKEMYNDPSTKKVPAIHAFGLKYGGVIIDNKYSYADIIKASGISQTYKAELDKAIGVYEIISGNNFNMSFKPIIDSKHISLQDRLAIALNLFVQKRKDSWLKNGRGVNGRNREYFDKLSLEKIQQFDESNIAELFVGVKGPEGNVVFNPMWAGTTGSGWGNIKPETEDETRQIVDFLVNLKNDINVNTITHPKGFGPSVISELLMKLHPDKHFKHGRVTSDVLTYLGLIDFKHKNNFSDAEYKIVCGEASKILEKMKAMKVPRQIFEDGSEDTKAPDYFTVNEFVWFVNENKDLIKEKIMAKKMNTEPAKKRDRKGKPLSFAKDSKEDELLLRLLSALRAKPFAILAGHSGTGKSRYVKKLAYMTCNGDGLFKEGQLPGNYLLLQVKPNWHDSTELLGFRNAMDDNKYQKTQLIEFLFKAYHYKDTPFFLCLDEMNLAPVEQYFAEFLSAMESKEPVALNDISASEDNLFELGCEWTDAQELLKENGFSIPKNLFIVGTVNMDETTNQFSRKVLDRAFTIEMTDVDFTKFGDVKEPSDEDLVEDAMIEALLNGKEEVVTKLDEEDMSEGSALIQVQSALKSTAFAIAYRFANEYTLLKRAIKVFDKDNVVGLDALDQAVLMKILPRIAGDDVYINKVYGEKETEGLKGALVGKNASLAKITEIMDRAKSMNAQYITFWP